MHKFMPKGDGSYKSDCCEKINLSEIQALFYIVISSNAVTQTRHCVLVVLLHALITLFNKLTLSFLMHSLWIWVCIDTI